MPGRSANANTATKRTARTMPSAPVMETSLRGPQPTREPPGSVQLEALEAELLTPDLKQKPRVIDEIAAPETTGLLLEPKEPLQSGAHHPARRLRDSPGMKIEGGPHADQN